MVNEAEVMPKGVQPTRLKARHMQEGATNGDSLHAQRGKKRQKGEMCCNKIVLTNCPSKKKKKVRYGQEVPDAK